MSWNEAITAFEQHILSLECSTQRKYKNVLRKFQEYCTAAGLRDVAGATIERLDAYRAARKISRVTSQKELETLRQFFGFCKERNWTDDNPAKRIKSAKNIKTAEVVPYTPDQLTCIIAACDGIGKAPYERKRARGNGAPAQQHGAPRLGCSNPGTRFACATGASCYARRKPGTRCTCRFGPIPRLRLMRYRSRGAPAAPGATATLPATGGAVLVNTGTRGGGFNKPFGRRYDKYLAP